MRALTLFPLVELRITEQPATGEIRNVQIFVATLGASHYTYVETCESQRAEHWLEAHANAFKELNLSVREFVDS